MSHSVPDTCSLAIHTPYGRVVHSGDWNLDPKPAVGMPTDGDRLKALGDEGHGIDLLHDGDQADDYLKSDSVDLIILDLALLV